MIEFLRLSIQNFLSVGKADMALRDQGLVLIEGINEDDNTAVSNGAGKSSILDALSWCLYGVTARGGSGDGVVNIKAGKDTMVRVTVNIDGAIYAVTRYRKHKIGKNRVELEMIEDAKDADDLTLGTDKLTQNRINQLLGCSADIFNASIYMGQENMPDLPAMTDKTLKAVLEEAMSLDRLDMALDVAKLRLATAEYDVQEVERKADQLLIKLDSVTTQHKLLVQATQDAYDELTTMKGEFEAEDKALQERLLDLRKQRAAWLVKQDGLGVVDPTTLRRRLEREVDNVYLPKIEAANQSLTKVHDHLSMMAGEQKVIDQAIKQADTKCGSCGREFDDTAERIKHLLAHKKRYDEIEEKKAQCCDVIDKLRVERDELRNTYNEKMRAVNTRVTNELRDYDEIRFNLQTLDKEITAVGNAHADMKIRAGKWLRLKTDKLADLRDEVADFAATIASLTTQRDELRDSRPRLQARLTTMQKVRDTLGRKGFRGEVLDQITPYLNARTQHYLTQLTDDNITATWVTLKENSDGDYVEDFHIEVSHKSGVERFALLSGGEKRKVRMACAMALQDLVGTRAIKPIKLFVADEIDDALDPAGLELLMGVLEQKAREVGTVLVISHNDLGDWVRQKITVRKRDGQSTIE
jgi:DNA repair exonuclease SbcCD ATPase subunit